MTTRKADAAAASVAIMSRFAREPGRSVAVRVMTPGRAWEGGAGEDVPRPAASLLKVPLAMAAETAFGAGSLSPAEAVPVRALLAAYDGRSPLQVLAPDHALSAAEVLGLCLSLSDRACATWLLGRVGLPAVELAAADAGCETTTMACAPADPAGPLVGETTARDALALLGAAADAVRYPLTDHALRNNIRDSRIPLGATDLDVEIAHKTGSLAGVANDVAVITCAGGTVWIAFLAEAQHDTLVTGYEMGICTRELLDAWGLGARGTRSVA